MACSGGARAMETGEQVGDVFQDAVFVTILPKLGGAVEAHLRGRRLSHAKRHRGGEPMAKQGFKVMDSDMHVMEPPDLWQRYIAPEFRDQAPVGLTSVNFRELRTVLPGRDPVPD